MKDLKEYLQYEQQVLDLLINKISKENNGNTIKTEYRFPIGNRLLCFDLVELNHEGKLIKIYEIKTPSAIRRNYQYVNYQLQSYQKVTGADVYLVYFGDDKELHIQQFSDSKNHIIKEKGKSQNVSMVESFSDFYERLKQICNNEGNELKNECNNNLHKEDSDDAPIVLGSNDINDLFNKRPHWQDIIS